jgi:RNA polymerase sigma-70 factor (ECF subfamily)
VKQFPAGDTTLSAPDRRDDRTTHDDASDAVLAERVRAGDAVAYETLFHRYFRPLHSFAFSYVRAADVAEDLTADVFVRVWEGRTRLTLTGSLRNYLYAAVRNEALAHLRRQRMVQRVHAAAVAAGRSPGIGNAPVAADRELQQRELAAALDEAIQRLPERAREALVLHRQHGFSYADVAATMGISPRTVEVHIRRAFQSLRVQLADFLVLLLCLVAAG